MSEFRNCRITVPVPSEVLEMFVGVLLSHCQIVMNDFNNFVWSHYNIKTQQEATSVQFHGNFIGFHANQYN